MDILNGTTLVRLGKDGTPSMMKAQEALSGKKAVVLYFSAHWCPPCRLFTPVLKDFYAEVTDMGIEIVFVSSDRTADDMSEYMRDQHGDWLAVKHGSDEAQALKQRFSISAVPTVVVLRASDGEVLTREGRAAIQKDGPKAAKDWVKA